MILTAASPVPTHTLISNMSDSKNGKIPVCSAKGFNAVWRCCIDHDS